MKADNKDNNISDFNTPLSIMARATRKKINKDIEDLNNTISQIDLKDIHRLFHSTITE